MFEAWNLLVWSYKGLKGHPIRSPPFTTTWITLPQPVTHALLGADLEGLSELSPLSDLFTKKGYTIHIC